MVHKKEGVAQSDARAVCNLRTCEHKLDAAPLMCQNKNQKHAASGAYVYAIGWHSIV